MNRAIIAFFQKLLPGLALMLALSSTAHAWWNSEWTGRRSFTIDTTPVGAAVADPVGGTPVLVRLHAGNFNFAAARDDGADLRFVAADDKTLLPYHFAHYDSLLGEAFVWVRVPEVKPAGQAVFWLYYGNPVATVVTDAKGTYDADTALVWHLGEHGQPPQDASGNANHGATAGVPVDGSLIGTGIHFDGVHPLTIPASPSLVWEAGAPLTWSVWLKPVALAPDAVVYSRRDGTSGLVLGLDRGLPFAEITSGGRSLRTPAGQALALNNWHHFAISAAGAQLTLYVDGKAVGTLAAALPALSGPATLGGDVGGSNRAGFTGDLVELQISKVARPAGFLPFAAASQGADNSKVLLAGDAEQAGGGAHAGGLSAAFEHVLLFGDIAKNMMFDGWIAVFVCLIMIVIGWTVALRKLAYLNKIEKGSGEFLAQWKQVSSDLTVLDHADAESVKSLGGTTDAAKQRLIQATPLYHIYHIGSEEIRHRLQSKSGFNGLSSRSIQAIKASLDAGLTRELHRLNDGLVYLTISIAGGPYVGLLGTVVGVMITFAVIAKTGQVEVNSIAPGIASALLATVAGLLVAIPALFIYSYLNNRIKNVASNLHLFIDEFIAKMAEFYPAGVDRGPIAKDDRGGL